MPAVAKCCPSGENRTENTASYAFTLDYILITL